ncbi:MAG TPA: divalent-cation tolerance protein CutA [Vicinamibacterales bacterium]|nr:divalent-cation tolerance protein CutA [Vicinamibacterales bacterium]
MRDLVVVLTTMPDDTRTDEVARALVDEHLAACVNVMPPMTSTYRWKGRVERDTERQIVIKTTRERLSALEQRVRQLHPYELPEFLVLTVESASADYAAWVSEQTRA